MRRVRGLSRISLSYNTLPPFSADASIYVSFSPLYHESAHTLLPFDMRSHNILGNATKCHDAPFSADALEKRFFPGEVTRQVFWLVPTATPSQFHHGISGLRRVAVRSRDLQQRELLPILTAFPFHRAEAPSASLRTLM